MINRELIKIIDGLGAPRVLIVGDLILDRYLTGDVTRISPEAPIPVLRARHSEERLGGAGNVASNLRAMKAEVEVLGVVGDDEGGEQVLDMLGKAEVDTSGCVRDPKRPTIVKTRMVSGVQQILRVDWEDSESLDSELATQLFRGIEERVERAGAVVLSDYGKGVLTEAGVQAVIRVASAAGVPVLVDPKGSDYSLYRGATLVTPNRKEAEEAIGHSIKNLDELPSCALELIQAADLSAAVITLGPDGIYYLEKNGDSGRVPTVARQVFDVTGAGDTVISQLALALAAGLPLRTAVQLSNHAAGIVVARRGAASVTRSELKAAVGQELLQPGKVVTREELALLLAEWRRAGRKVAFTNGCFDVLHRGHVEYLQFARSKGDVLIVGVNDDDSIRRLKGEGRPINGIEDRMHVLAALQMVDAVVVFGEDTPKDIVQFVTPDALIKGEDWAEKGVVGREWVEQHGGKVHLAPLLAGRSTTSIIERIQGDRATTGR